VYHPGFVKTLLTVSILLATFILPTLVARAREPRRALWQMLGALFLFEVGYAAMLYVVYLKLGFG